MFTIISFILTLLGSINWLMIGLLQYDFVAGIFGYQASILSRIIYIIIGASSVFLVYKMIKCKGTIPIFTRRNKKDVAKNIDKMKEKYSHNELAREHQPIQNVEADKDVYRDSLDEPYEPFPIDEDYNKHQSKGLFDEHFDGE